MHRKGCLHLSTRTRHGQSTVEYMLVISVIVIAAWAAAQYFVPQYKAGMEAMQSHTNDYVSDGVVGGQ